MSPRLSQFLSSFTALLVGVGLLSGGTISAEVLRSRNFSSSAVPGLVQPTTTTALAFQQFPSAGTLRPLVFSASTSPSTLNAAALYVIDDDTNTVLWSKNSTSTRSLASITKLMTALVLTELPITWSLTTTIQKSDSDGSQTHLKIGETYSLSTLWQVGLVGSSNTAISALVRMSGVPLDAFVALMNAKAKRLKMPTLSFVEPTGLDPRNIGSAQDVARLLRFALRSDQIFSTLARPSVTVYPPSGVARQVWSTNWLLTRWIPHGFGTSTIGKTGYIGESGYNFAVRLDDREGHAIRVVVLGALLAEDRFIEARDLGDWVFAHTLWPDQPGYPAPFTSISTSTTSEQTS